MYIEYLQVIILATFYALIIKKPDKAQQERDNSLEHDEVKRHLLPDTIYSFGFKNN